MTSDIDKIEREVFGDKSPPSPPVPPFTPRNVDAPAVRDLREDLERKRIELDIKKQEIEIERLGKPNTQIDYFDKMLLLQQQHFNQLIESEKRHADMRLEIEKLKLSQNSSGEMDWIIDIIAPMLPQLLNKNKDSNEFPQEIKGGEKPKLTPEQYLDKIRSGEITPEIAFEDFKIEFPDQASKMTIEQFKLIYENIKINGLPQQVKDRMDKKNENSKV